MSTGYSRNLHKDVTDKEDREADLVLRADEAEVFFQALETGGSVVIPVSSLLFCSAQIDGRSAYLSM
jgi:hypothetical protein